MPHRVIAFADGENLVCRYEDMLKDGRIPDQHTTHIPGLCVWHPEVSGQFLGDYHRISYYQTVVGDQSKLEMAAAQISEIKYSYEEEYDAFGSGSLRPRLFKKEKRSSKTKSVDINLTVDMLRHAFDTRFDVLLLASGDGDFLPLVEEVMRAGKLVWIAAFSKGINKQLRYSCDEFIDLDRLFFSQGEPDEGQIGQ